MIRDGNAAGLAAGGDMSGLDQLFQNGQYDECLNLAERQGGDILSGYLERYTTMLV